MRGEDMKQTVPVWEKYALTVEEAAAYFGIGQNKLRELVDKDGRHFVLHVGNKKLIKRHLFERYIDGQNII